MDVSPGTKVRFTAIRLGLLATPEANKFEPDTVSTGDTGVYEGPHADIEDWHLIRVGDLYCPCHESHFEVIS